MSPTVICLPYLSLQKSVSEEAPTSVLTPSTLEQTLAPVLKGSSSLVKVIIIKHWPFPGLPRCEDARARRVLMCPPSSTSE